jgi:hypothetical protein
MDYRPTMEVFQADTQDSDVATAQTIQAMCRYIHQAAQDQALQWTAEEAVAQWAGWSTEGNPIPGAFWWARHNVDVLRHDQFKALLAAYPEKRQLLVSPSVVLRAPKPAGDCSTFSMLIAAMLETLGVEWELVTVAVEPEDPTLYSHVFVRAVLADGRRVTLDGSHGKYPGWEVPRAHQFRRQVWDESGDAVEDQASPVSVLHGYEPRPGLGQDDSTDSTDITAASELAAANLTATLSEPAWYEEGYSSAAAASAAGYDPTTGLAVTTVPTSSGASATGYVAPSQSSAQWAAFAAALAKGGMTLAEINAIQPGTVVGANGQILRQATGLPVPVGTGLTAALGSSSSMLLIGGVVVVALLFAMMSGSRR